MALSSGPNLGLLVSGALGEAHYTELLRLLRGLDGLVLLSVRDRHLNTPPASPADGDRYIVGSSPTGAWAGKAGYVARYSTATAGWEFYAPREGWYAYVADEAAYVTYTGTAWNVALTRSTGWSAPTGTASRAAFDTETVTTQELARVVKGLIDDLTAQGRLSA